MSDSKFISELPGPFPPCWSCRHKGDGPVCAAFPRGIPNEILRGVHQHRRPYPGDRGIRYRPVEERNS